MIKNFRRWLFAFLFLDLLIEDFQALDARLDELDERVSRLEMLIS